MGAGAVGCYYGGMLARAGHDVRLVGRAPHVAAVCRDGLFLETQSFQSVVPMQATTDASGVHGAQLVLCCVKSSDSEAAAAAMRPHLAPDALVLSLQNGVDNAERLRAILQREVMPAVVYVASEMAAPGHVRHHGRGELLIGPSPASDELLGLFSAAGVPVQISDNLADALWAKLMVNCACNALSAITQLPYGRLVQGQGVEQTMQEVLRECLAVARSEGVSVPGDVWESVQQIARSMPTQLSSTAQDLARRRRSEIDHLNGYVVSKGDAAGIPVPVNRALHALVRLLEGRF